mmetsp:Transcript_19575/g.29029  ORF Transcript_19575/g.29029 Transcript_19575/m.29029 type:complete len:1269 (+) Transcript_19575:83-3889(+)
MMLNCHRSYIVFLLVSSSSAFLPPRINSRWSAKVLKSQKLSSTKDESIERGKEEFQPYFSFPLDDWQLQAGGEILQNRNIIVCAPTGSGKTVVGEMALHMCMKQQTNGIYTTPLKALSNQKFAELRQIFGKSAVGLSTGDISINREANARVMTTEVYRNMAWRSISELSSIPSSSLNNEGDTELSNNAILVLDEFHYMGQPGRGGVWEESVITTPPHTQIVCLSATLPNGLQLAQWMEYVTGRKTVLVEASQSRPVPLRYLFATKRGLYPLFSDSDAGPGSPKGLLGLRGDGIQNLPPNSKERKNDHKSKKEGKTKLSLSKDDSSFPNGLKINPLLKSASNKRQIRIENAVERLRITKNNKKGDFYATDNRGSYLSNSLSVRDERRERERLLRREMRKEVPSLTTLVQRLEQKNLLPAILFIFSRVGCENAASDVARQLLGPVRDRVHDSENEEYEVDKEQKRGSRKSHGRSRAKKSENRIRDKDGRQFRKGGNYMDDDAFASMLEGVLSEMNEEMMGSFAEGDPLNSENWDFLSRVGLLSYDQVKQVASRVASFNAENEEIAFEEVNIEQFLLGIGSHHAGQLPAHKAFVESLYRAQLMKIVFATETLAAGINMPAKTTCICAMAKRGDGGTINLLETSNLLQMAGRAGRRGMDTDGTCVLVSTPFESEEDAASILTSEIKPITSQFSPSYPLVINLISRGKGNVDVARQLVGKSFAMWERSLAERKLSSIITEIDDPVTELLTATTHQQFIVFLISAFEAKKEDSIDGIQSRTFQKLIDILDDRKMLKTASKSYIGLSQRFDAETKTLQHLQDELVTTLSSLQTEDEDILGPLLADDESHIKQQIEIQSGRVSSVEKEINSHVFTTIAAQGNIVMESNSPTGEVVRAVFAEIQERQGSVKTGLTGKDLSVYAKSIITMKRTKKNIDPSKSSEVIEEANKKVSFTRDGTWEEMIALMKVLVCYGCLESDNWKPRDTDDDLESSSFTITTAGQHVGMLSFENSLWGLVAMGGAHDVVGASSELDELRFRMEEFQRDLGILEDESDSEMFDSLFGPSPNSEKTEEREESIFTASQKEAALLTKKLLGLTAHELAGYVSCIVSDGRRDDSRVIESFEQLTNGQKEAVQSALEVSERLVEVQKECGTKYSSTNIELDLSTAKVVTAWASGCSWSDALKLSGLAPGDLVRMLGRVMDALRQFGKLPYNPVRSSSFGEGKGVFDGSLGLGTDLRNLCRDAATSMDRYPVKDPLPFETDDLETEEGIPEDEEEK